MSCSVWAGYARGSSLEGNRTRRICERQWLSRRQSGTRCAEESHFLNMSLVSRYRSDQPSKHHLRRPGPLPLPGDQPHHGNALRPALVSCVIATICVVLALPLDLHGDWACVSRSARADRWRPDLPLPRAARAFLVIAAWLSSPERIGRPPVPRVARIGRSCEPVPARHGPGYRYPRDVGCCDGPNPAPLAGSSRRASPPVRWIGLGTARRWRRSRLTTRPALVTPYNANTHAQRGDQSCTRSRRSNRWKPGRAYRRR